MTIASTTVTERAKLVVRRDLRAVRKLLRQIRHSARLADFCLFNRRTPARMLSYMSGVRFLGIALTTLRPSQASGD